ncbi:MAG: hotdog domain-containing protein [Actinomycetota bacterium]
MADEFEKIPGRYGFSIERTGPVSVSGRMPMHASVADGRGVLRSAAVLMAVDMACGMAAGLGVVPEWTVTADADVRFVGVCTVGPLRVDAFCVRGGRTMSIVDARVVDEGRDDALVAVATANHGVLTPEFEHVLASAEVGYVWEFAPPDDPGDTIEEYFGLDREDGACCLPLTVRTTNPWGIFHGGLTGLLVDTAARDAGLVDLRDVGLRFLNPVKTGPAAARVVADHARAGDRVLRIEITDGPGGRLAVIGQVSGS